MNLQQKRYQFKYQPMADISSINNVDQIGIFFDTIKNKNFEEANKIMSEHNISIFSTDPQKNTILHHILLNVINNNITIADCIEICNNVQGIWGLMNVKNSNKQTPLHLICKGQLMDIYNLIPPDILGQINYNIHDSYGRLALHYCIIGKQLDLPLFHYFYKYLKSQKNLTDEIKNIDMLMYKYKISNKDDKQMIKSNLYKTINKCINKLQSTIIYIPEMGKVKFVGINTLQDNNDINTDSVQLQDEQTTIISEINVYYRISVVLYYIYKTLHITALLFFELNSINKANTLNTQSEYMCSLAIHIINILYHFSIGKKINIDKHLKICINNSVKKSIKSDILNYSILIQNVYYFILNSDNINLSYINNINIDNILLDMYKYINTVNDYINIEMHFNEHILRKICICLLNLIDSLICMEHYNKDIKKYLPLNITSIRSLYNNLILKHNSLITRVKSLDITDSIYTYYHDNGYLDFSRIENLQERQFIPKSGDIQQIYNNIFNHQIVSREPVDKVELNKLPQKYKDIVSNISANIEWEEVFDTFKKNFRVLRNTILEYTKKNPDQKLNSYCDYIQNIIEHIIDLMNEKGFVRYQCMCALLLLFTNKSDYDKMQTFNNEIEKFNNRINNASAWIDYWNDQYKRINKEINDIIRTDSSNEQRIIKCSIYFFCEYCSYLYTYNYNNYSPDQHNIIYIITIILNIIKRKEYVEDQFTIKCINLIKYVFNRYLGKETDNMIQFIYGGTNKETDENTVIKLYNIINMETQKKLQSQSQPLTPTAAAEVAEAEAAAIIANEERLLEVLEAEEEAPAAAAAGLEGEHQPQSSRVTSAPEPEPAAEPPKEEEEEEKVKAAETPVAPVTDTRLKEGQPQLPSSGIATVVPKADGKVDKKTDEEAAKEAEESALILQNKRQIEKEWQEQWQKLTNQRWPQLIEQQLQQLSKQQQQHSMEQLWQQLMNKQLWQLMEQQWWKLINEQWDNLSEERQKVLINQQWRQLSEQQQKLIDRRLKQIPNRRRRWQLMEREWRESIEGQWLTLTETQWQQIIKQLWKQLMAQQSWQLLTQQWDKLSEERQQELINQQWREAMIQQHNELMKRQLTELIEHQWPELIKEQWQQYQQSLQSTHATAAAAAAVAAPEESAADAAPAPEPAAAELSPVEKQRIGDRIYAQMEKIPGIDKEEWGWVTGMMLKSLRPDELRNLVKNQKALVNKIGEACEYYNSHPEEVAAMKAAAQAAAAAPAQATAAAESEKGEQKKAKEEAQQSDESSKEKSGEEVVPNPALGVSSPRGGSFPPSSGRTKLESANKTNHKQINLPDISNIDLQSIFNKLLNGGTKSILSTIYDNLDINHNLKTTYQSGGDISKYYTDHVCLLYNVYRDISTLSYYYFNYELYDEISKHTIYRPDETDIYNKSINYYIQLNTLLSLKKHNKKLFIFKTKDNKDIYKLLSDGSKNNIMLWLIHDCMLLSLLDKNISDYDILKNILEHLSQSQTGGYSIPFNDIKYISDLYLDNLTDPILTNDEKYNLFISYKKQLQDDNSYDKYSTNTIFNKINTYLSKLFNRIYNYIFE